ncbi:hypothetical protein [Aestuariivirga sp.]|uniref:hypothetical protein n=1 Tax=Aestuariivirga sp. TaxID=2650926 RepID=UPI0039E2EB23
METLVPLILQIIAGGVGGMAGGSLIKKTDLGAIGNIIAGAVGGIGGSQLLPVILGMATNPDGMLSNLAASGIGGLVLQLVVGLIKAYSSPRSVGND